MKHTSKMREHGYPGVGLCIYCMTPRPKLTDEHIIARALNGTLVFKDAVCEECRDYTNREFENKALQADLLVPRLLLELRRRHKDIPKKLPPTNVVTANDEAIQAITLELSDYPPLVEFMLFDPAGALVGKDQSGDLEWVRFVYLKFPSLTFLSGHKSVETRHMHDWTAFTKTLAKIAYCFAAAECGIDSFKGEGIRDLLLGKRSDVLNFVGGPLTHDTVPNNQLHFLKLNRRGDNVTVSVNLFASYTPIRYEVFVGAVAHSTPPGGLS